MGTYFNPGNASFRQVTRSETYVDKTGLLEELNRLLCTEAKCVAVRHARRFGKSQAAGMVDAYYTVVRDLPAGKGFADIALIPRADSGAKPPMVIELKWDASADSAIRQIKERRYAGALAGFGGEVLLVGVGYDKDDPGKRHTCTIETVRL